MTSGLYTYDGGDDDDHPTFDIDWYAEGDIGSTRQEQHERLLEATAKKVAPKLQAALDIGEHIKLESVRLRLTHWQKPDVKVWFLAPPGYLTEDHDDPDAAEKVAQRKEFYREHNSATEETLYVDSNWYDITIDVRQF